ncbi:Ff.00g034840.m01.CDS01 [Fusarium sp. VM40]|nr:Ff.00g034840.m01.CDS01 [Fusarium sp. VM40]
MSQFTRDSDAKLRAACDRSHELNIRCTRTGGTESRCDWCDKNDIDLGYMYSGPFRGLSRLSRKLGSSEGSIRRPAFGEDDSKTTLIFHPGMLDNALQGLFAAHSAPGDGRLWSMRAPTACRRVSLVPSLCGRNMTEEVDFDCTLTDSRNDFITGDVEVYTSAYAQRIIEIEGLSFSPFAAATEKDDRQLFQEQIWCVNEADGPLVLGDKFPTAEERSKAMDAERAAFFYLKKLHLSVPSDQRSQLPWYLQSLLDNAERLYELVCNGKYSYAPQSWSQDTEEEAYTMMNGYGLEDAEFNLTKAVGENLPLVDVLKGETNILQYMTQNNYLDRYYTHAIGFGWLDLLISGVVGQIADKHPQMRFLEIGAGTGGATGAVLERIGQAYSSYTYTDISSGFFERAGAKFQDHAGKMLFKMLDIEKDPVTQGFTEHSYDIILVANVLHATKNLSETLQNTRRLLKPGGFLVLMEILGNDVMRIGLVMGGLPGWWVGKDDGRRWGPTTTIDEWDSLLKGTGFAGVDTHTPMPDTVQMPGSVFVAQAIDDRIAKLRDPLRHDALPSTESGDVEVIQNGHTTPHDKSKEKTHLVVVGGKSTSGGKLTSAIICLLGPFFAQIHVPDIDSKEVLTKVPHDVNLHIVSLVERDLDGRFFHNISKSTWQNFQHLLGASPASLLWVVTNTRNGNPLGAIGTGLFRSLFYELPEAKFQVLDLDEKATQAIDSSAALIANLMQQSRLATEASSTTVSSALTPTTSEDGGHSMSDDTASVKMLWTTEPELYLDDG